VIDFSILSYLPLDVWVARVWLSCPIYHTSSISRIKLPQALAHFMLPLPTARNRSHHLPRGSAGV
jgi:hypothetical protein